jgi:hypothetical protein
MYEEYEAGARAGGPPVTTGPGPVPGHPHLPTQTGADPRVPKAQPRRRPLDEEPTEGHGDGGAEEEVGPEFIGYWD